MTKVVTNLTKGKRITDGPSLQEEPTSWKDSIDPSIAPNLDDLCEQEKLKKNLSGQSKHVNMQQRWNLLDKKLKEIEGVNDLTRVDPKKLSLVPDVVIRPSSRCRSSKNMMEPTAVRTIWPHIVTRLWGKLVTKIC